MLHLSCTVTALREASDLHFDILFRLIMISHMLKTVDDKLMVKQLPLYCNGGFEVFVERPITFNLSDY